VELSACGLWGITEQATKAQHQTTTHMHRSKAGQAIAKGFIEW
jgi:hypothetical protein